MGVEVVRGSSHKPVSSERLGELLDTADGLTGQLFIGYPIIGTPTGPYMVDALLISKEIGIVVFDLVEGADLSEYEARQDDSVNMLEARLKTYRELMSRRELLVPVRSVSFAPGLTSPVESDDTYRVANDDTLAEQLRGLKWPTSQEGIFERALSALESISTIRQTRPRRTVKSEDSKGAKLKGLEDSIATLDNLQGRAVIETVDGVQRIRGLAGSGKTIVLALKAAYLHAQHPDWRIAVTFNTRSLKGLFRRLITNFSLEQASREPEWDNLRVLTAWGAPGGPERDGIYYEFCRNHEVDYLNLSSARHRFGRRDPFSFVCADALQHAKEIDGIYDAILIDEAQDFTPAFLQLCYSLLKEPKRLVFAYDELQNLTEETLPSPVDIFGAQSQGINKVWINNPSDRGPRHDIILDKCYRNSRPVLVTAHALGFGIYRQPPPNGNTGLIQMFDNSQLWEDVGYRVKSGEVMDGRDVSLIRPPETSPLFLENHSSINDLIQFKTFNDEQQQAMWLARDIQENLGAGELSCDDIFVINPDPVTTRDKSGLARSFLAQMKINSHIAGLDTDPDTFYKVDEESITFTGIHRAKGNEAGMVYIINAQDCHSAAWNLANIRNRLFTAITRSKGWIRVLGIGDGMQALSYEYERLRDAGFALEFKYPSAEERQHLRIVHRDMAESERRRLEGQQRYLRDLVADLQNGVVVREDLDMNLLAGLKEFLT